MRLLHTSDWHLGQKFHHLDRKEEHNLALDWLIELIKKEKIDIIVIAGDIYDIQNPPNYAQELYYKFLGSVTKTNCQHVVVIGGNHDSPAHLDAPKSLLTFLNIHIVGAVSEKMEDDFLILKDRKDNPMAMVACIPFLRDQDIRRSISGEKSKDRIERIKKGILKYYKGMGEIAKEKRVENVPIIGTGHLYAKGAKASAKQDNIYIENRENIAASQIGDDFDYVALGHIHREQALEKCENVRYAGSIIPLQFKETEDRKSVTILDFKGQALKEIRQVPVPEFRRLKSISGDFDKIITSLTRFVGKDRELTPWVEIEYKAEEKIPNINQKIREFAKDLPIVITAIRIFQEKRVMKKAEIKQNLEELTPKSVFEMQCDALGHSKETKKSMMDAFVELVDEMRNL